jgi:putative membrane protein
MNRILVNWLVTGIAIVIATKLLSGQIVYNGTGQLPLRELVIFALVLGLLNAVVAPVIKILAFPITLLTLGLFSLVINAAMFWFAAGIVHVQVAGFVTAFIAALIVSVVNMILGRAL